MIMVLVSNKEVEIVRVLINLGLKFEDVNGGVVFESRLVLMVWIFFDICYV